MKTGAASGPRGFDWLTRGRWACVRGSIEEQDGNGVDNGQVERCRARARVTSAAATCWGKVRWQSHDVSASFIVSYRFASHSASLMRRGLLPGKGGGWYGMQEGEPHGADHCQAWPEDRPRADALSVQAGALQEGAVTSLE